MRDESTAVLQGQLERAVTGDAEAQQRLLDLTRDRLMRGRVGFDSIWEPPGKRPALLSPSYPPRVPHLQLNHSGERALGRVADSSEGKSGLGARDRSARRAGPLRLFAHPDFQQSTA